LAAEPDWEFGWLDRQLRDTPLVVLLLFSCCGGEIALIFGSLGARPRISTGLRFERPFA
jgi:hypothetical protein